MWTPAKKLHPPKNNESERRALLATTHVPYDYLESLRLWYDASANCARTARKVFFLHRSTRKNDKIKKSIRKKTSKNRQKNTPQA